MHGVVRLEDDRLSRTARPHARFAQSRYPAAAPRTSPTWGERKPPPAPPILETKLRPSATRPDVVERIDLVSSIVGSPLPVVMVSAPAGYGKTTLLAQSAAA